MAVQTTSSREPRSVADVLHPDEALVAGERPFPVIAACDHYAGTEARMKKALALQVEYEGRFDVTLDLEDGAPSGEERDHAALVVEMLRSEHNTYRRAGVRIHDHDSPHWKDDVKEVVGGAGELLSHITIPKVLGPRPLSEMIHDIQAACAAAGLEREIPLHVLVETHGAIQDAYSVASLPWLRTLEFGIMDFVSSHHGAIGSKAMESPGQFEHQLVRRAKTRLVAAALGNGLVPVHNVTIDVKNRDQVRDDAHTARREFGFLRMWSIHPRQIEPILEAFAPDAGETGRAGIVLLAGRQAHWGPVSVDGRLYDRASYRYYWELLKRARVAGRQLAADVEETFFN